MEIIKLKELKQNDMFCYEMKLKGREAFLCTSNDNGVVEIKSRSTGVVSKVPYSYKAAEKQVILLRNLND